jgi:N-sulfoglucosamine sulfohydrolase
MRMIRTGDFLYIQNYEPDRWPAGDYRVVNNEGRYGDVDASPTKTIMIERKENDTGLFNLAFGKRPCEELYDCRSDPYQIHNLASEPDSEETVLKLMERLTAYLKATGDPRETAGDSGKFLFPLNR